MFSRLQRDSGKNIKITWKQKHATPEFKKYLLLSDRIESYIGWPQKYVGQTPQDLAQAGFFYMGSADRVTCFQCGITIRDWTSGNNPMEEHKIYSENCPFVTKHNMEELGVVPRRSALQRMKSLSSSGESLPSLTGREVRSLESGLIQAKRNSASQYDSDLKRPRGSEEVDLAGMGAAAEAEEMETAGVSSGCMEKEDSAINGCGMDEDIMDGMSRKRTQYSKDMPTEADTDIHVNVGPESGTDDQREESVVTSNSFFHSLARKSRSNSPVKAKHLNLKAKTICHSCNREQATIVFLPCGHRVTCSKCSEMLEKCPKCQLIIGATIVTFLS